MDDLFFLDESVEADLKWPLIANSFISNVVYLIRNKNFLKSCKSIIWQLIQDSYSNIGGYEGHDNVKTLIKDSYLSKFVFSDDGQIVAFALYSNRFDGHKRFCSASNKKIANYKTAVKDIAKDDTQDFDGFYWLEASEGIEKVFKENGGNPIPNAFASEFLKIPTKNLTLDSDEVHYIRKVGKNHDKIRKMIFGFKDKETAIKVCSAVANYDEFKIRKNAEEVVSLFHESDIEEAKQLEWACAIVNKLAEFRNEWGCREMLPDWRKAANEAKKILVKATMTKLNLAQMPFNIALKIRQF